jgi:hypothetical protein
MRILCVAVALALLAIPARADVSITISKASQQMAVSVDGGAPMVWPVSTGRDGYNTPTGSFRAIRLEEVYFSKKYDDAPMPNSIFFYGGYAIHGTYEERNLGRPASRGCVRLSRANAAHLFALARAHGMSRTHISITDGPLRSYGVPMARGHDRYERGYERSLAARSVPERYTGRTIEPRPHIGFQQFDNRWRNVPLRSAQPRIIEQRPRIERRGERPRERGLIVPGRTYSEAEYRRLMGEQGWR